MHEGILTSNSTVTHPSILFQNSWFIQHACSLPTKCIPWTKRGTIFSFEWKNGTPRESGSRAAILQTLGHRWRSLLTQYTLKHLCVKHLSLSLSLWDRELKGKGCTPLRHVQSVPLTSTSPRQITFRLRFFVIHLLVTPVWHDSLHYKYYCLSLWKYPIKKWCLLITFKIRIYKVTVPDKTPTHF